MAHTYSVGDSIAVGCGLSGKVEHAYATSGMPVQAMGEHFAEVTAAAQAGDTVIVSAGYNGGLNSAGKAQLTEWISALTHKGVKVGILGLRESWPNGGAYAHLRGTTQAQNASLREIARETGAVFDGKATDIANGLPGGEIHGNFGQLADSCLEAVRKNSGAAAAPASAVDSPARTPAAMPATPAPAPKPVNATLSEADIEAVQKLGLKEHADLGSYGTNKDGVDGKLGRLTAKAILALEKQHPDELVGALGKDKAQAVENAAHAYMEQHAGGHGLPHRPKTPHQRD